MKNKKLIIVSILIVMTIILVCFAGCQKSFSLSDMFDQESAENQPKVQQSKMLTALNGYEINSSGESFVLASKYDDKKAIVETILYNIESDKILLTLKENFDQYTFEFADKHAIVKNTQSNITEIFDMNGSVFSATNASFTNTYNLYFRFLEFSNGKLVLINRLTYESVVKDNKPSAISNYLAKMGDYYVDIVGEDNMCYYVYDQNLDLVNTLDIQSKLNISENTSIVGQTLIGNSTIIIQTTTALPEDVSSYDIMIEKSKYSFKTFKIDLKSGNVLEIDTNIIFQSSNDYFYNYNIFAYSKIENKTLTELSLGIFDNELNLLCDLNKYLMVDFDTLKLRLLDNSDVFLSNGDMAVIVNKKGEIRSTFNVSDTTYLGSILIKASGKDTLIYDYYGNLIINLDENTELVASAYNSNILYLKKTYTQTQEDGSEKTTTEYIAYDMTKKTSTVLGTDSEVSFNTYAGIYTIQKADADGKMQMSAYLVSNGNKVFENMPYSSSRFLSNDGNHLHILTDADGKTTYYYYFWD